MPSHTRGSPTALRSMTGPSRASTMSSVWGPMSSSAPRSTRHGVANTEPDSAASVTKLAISPRGRVCFASSR